MDTIKKYKRNCCGFGKSWTEDSEYCIDCKKINLDQYECCKKDVKNFLKEMTDPDECRRLIKAR